MTTTAKQKRTANIQQIGENAYRLILTINGERRGYYVEPFAAMYGLGFHLTKFLTQQKAGEPTGYDVLIDGAHGANQCGCKVHEYRGRCKHVEAITALVRSGKLAGIASKRAQVVEDSRWEPDDL